MVGLFLGIIGLLIVCVLLWAWLRGSGFAAFVLFWPLAYLGVCVEGAQPDAITGLLCMLVVPLAVAAAPLLIWAGISAAQN